VLLGARNGEVGSTAIMSQSRSPCCPAQYYSLLTLVDKQNSHNRMTLEFVEYLYFSALECGFA